MNEDVYPSYWSVMPANVRYDKRLKPMERILYCEITALTHVTGYCYASNNYFAKLYKVIPGTISRYIQNLKKYGYISINYIHKKDSKEIKQRCINVVIAPNELPDTLEELLEQYPISKTNNTYEQNCLEGYEQFCLGGISRIAKENSTSINKTSINNTLANIDCVGKSEKKVKSNTKTFTIPTADEIKNYAQEIEFGELYYEPEKFIDYYDSVGWMVGGKTKMKDWKAAVRTWKRNHQGNTSSTKPIPEKKERELTLFERWYPNLSEEDQELWWTENFQEEGKKMGIVDNWTVEKLNKVLEHIKENKK